MVKSRMRVGLKVGFNVELGLGLPWLIKWNLMSFWVVCELVHTLFCQFCVFTC